MKDIGVILAPGLLIGIGLSELKLTNFEIFYWRTVLIKIWYLNQPQNQATIGNFLPINFLLKLLFQYSAHQRLKYFNSPPVISSTRDDPEKCGVLWDLTWCQHDVPGSCIILDINSINNTTQLSASWYNRSQLCPVPLFFTLLIKVSWFVKSYQQKQNLEQNYFCKQQQVRSEGVFFVLAGEPISCWQKLSCPTFLELSSPASLSDCRVLSDCQNYLVINE